MKALVDTFNQEKALVGALSVIMKTDRSFTALILTMHGPDTTLALFSHLSPGERRDIITHNVVTEWRRLATSDHASVDILHFHVVIQTWTLDNESLSINTFRHDHQWF